MADQVRSLVMVENETYELIDGDGHFYVSKTNLGPIAPTFQTNDPFATLANTEYQETFSSIADNPISHMSQLSVHLPSVVPPQTTNMEPILINDYGKMNFFTQVASNVTIYLNSNNGGSFVNDGYSQDSSNDVIDLTTSSLEDSRKQQEEKDLPEFIDVSQLKMPYKDCGFYDVGEEAVKHAEVAEHTEVAKHTEEVESSDVMQIEEDDDDDDVVFVKEYKIDDNDLKDDENALPLDLRNRCEKKEKSLPEPRRNPKRTVQLIKEYYNNFRYSPDCYESGKRKRSGVNLSPPSLLTNEHFKEWPTEGMHEKPTYNVASKKLEKFDCGDKKAPVKKTSDVVKKRCFKKGKRRTGKTKVKEDTDEQISKEFATLTHETLQEVIDYIQQVKQYNLIMKGVSNMTESDDTQKENVCEQNLENAKDILTNCCILYSIANDVPQKSVAKYLKNIKKDLKL